MPTSFSMKTTASSGGGSVALLGAVPKPIAVTSPFGTDVTTLIATFATTGKSVKVGATVQVSGTTPNDFTNPVVYTVTAADNSIATEHVRAPVTRSSPMPPSALPYSCLIR